MDQNGHIYRAPEDEIPAEDKARLDGFLRGRAEVDKALISEARAKEMEARVRELGGDAS